MGGDDNGGNVEKKKTTEFRLSRIVPVLGQKKIT